MRRFGQNAIATPANAMTVSRLVLAVPVLIFVYRQGSEWLTVAGWFLLSVTDGLDGWIARRDGTTRSGAFLDPLADKILVLGGFGVLASRHWLPWVAFWIVAVRELGISAYRSFAARRGISMPARKLGKAKTFMQLSAVGVVLLPWTASIDWLHSVVLWLAVALTVVSGLDIVAHGMREPKPIESDAKSPGIEA
jgi:CDP-diacylglycerol--glycerol-3-phosphate 3-phosphatidyltransferase